MKFYTLSIIFFLSACNPEGDMIRHERSNSGHTANTTNELTKVIAHFEKNQKDSLKLRAATFLIRNITGLITLDSNCTKGTTRYFELLDSAFRLKKSKLGFHVVRNVIDGFMRKTNDKPIQPKPLFFNESDIVKSEFLIQAIDHAFMVWRQTPWGNQISFDEFCEYILPYRCTNTYSVKAIAYFYRRYWPIVNSLKNTKDYYYIANIISEDIDSWFTEDGMILFNYPFLKTMTFDNLLMGKVGVCIDVTSIKVIALRSVGIPTALDQIPNWGNLNSSHFWYKVVGSRILAKEKKIDNTNVLKNTQHLITGSSYDSTPVQEGFPTGVKVSFVRTIPKVYREMFSIQKKSLAAIESNLKSVPPFFRNDRLADVSIEYLETADINIKLDSLDGKILYLCVFDNFEWKPVAWTNIKNGNAHFENIGRNITYLPAYFDNEKIIPAHAPIHVNNRGDYRAIRASNNYISIKAHMKYPYRNFIHHWQNLLIGGKFVVSNNLDFSDSMVVYEIKKTPFYYTMTEITLNKPFRYVLYTFDKSKEVHIGEMNFFSRSQNKQDSLLSGNLIGNKGMYPQIIDNIRDSNRTSFFTADPLQESYVGMDLGDSPKVVTKIGILARNDDNVIVSGENYRLYYWNRQWIPVGVEKGKTDKTVTFKKVPEGALYLLKNIAGGTENRIFEFKDGKQIFW